MQTMQAFYQLSYTPSLLLTLNLPKAAHGGQFPPLSSIQRAVQPQYGGDKTVLCSDRNAALIQLMCKVGPFNPTFHIIRTQAGKGPIRWQFQIPMVIIAPVSKVSR